MYYKEFKNMAEIHPEGVSENGRYKMQYVEAREMSDLAKLMNPEYATQKDQTVCVLRDTELQEIVMSDSAMEQDTNIEHVRGAKGDVLIAGMGMGMILLAMQDRPEITSITVIEISQELHDFVRPNLDLNDKVNIIISDIHDYIPDRKFDTVYCDIWNDISANNYEEMNDLSYKFKDVPKVSHWRFDRTEELAEEDYGY